MYTIWSITPDRELIHTTEWVLMETVGSFFDQIFRAALSHLRLFNDEQPCLPYNAPTYCILTNSCVRLRGLEPRSAKPWYLLAFCICSSSIESHAFSVTVEGTSGIATSEAVNWLQYIVVIICQYVIQTVKWHKSRDVGMLTISAS